MNSAINDRQRQLRQLVEAHDRLQRQLHRPSGGDGYELRHTSTAAATNSTGNYLEPSTTDFDVVPLCKKVPHFQPSSGKAQDAAVSPSKKPQQKSPVNKNRTDNNGKKADEEVDRLRKELETMNQICKSLEHALAQSSDSPSASADLLTKWRLQVFKSMLQTQLAQDTIISQSNQITNLNSAVSGIRLDLDAAQRRSEKLQSTIDKLQSGNKQLLQLNEEYRSIVGQIVLDDQERHEEADRQALHERQQLERTLQTSLSGHSRKMELNVQNFMIGVKDRFDKMQKRMWYLSDRLHTASQLLQHQDSHSLPNNNQNDNPDVEVMKRMISDRDRVIAVLSAKLNHVAQQQQLLLNQNQIAENRRNNQEFLNMKQQDLMGSFENFEAVSHIRPLQPTYLPQPSTNHAQHPPIPQPPAQPVIEPMSYNAQQEQLAIEPVINEHSEHVDGSRQELVKSLHQLQKLQELSRELLM